MSQFLAYTSVTALMFVGILLIFIVLLQRGRGGGLAGALGGAGGQSALGTKAGDVFTKITIVLATIWIMLACLSIYALRDAELSRSSGFADEPTRTEAGIEATGDGAGTLGTTPAGGAAGTPASATDGNEDAGAAGAAAAPETGGPALGAPAESAPAEPAAASEEAAATEEPAAPEN